MYRNKCEINQAILLYLLGYQNRIEQLSHNKRYPDRIYNDFFEIHFGIHNKFLLYLHYLISPCRFFMLLLFFTFKFCYACYEYCCSKRKQLSDKELYLLFDTLLLERSRGANLFNKSRSWLLSPVLKKRVELEAKEQYTVFNFIKITDILRAYYYAIISFFVLCRKYCYKLTIYHYCCFDFFLVYRCLKYIPKDISIYFSTQVDRWAILFDKSHQINKILIQHGIESPSAYWKCRFSNVETVYAISEKEAQYLIHACFKIFPKEIFYMNSTLSLTKVESKYNKNVLIISYSADYFEQECQLIQKLSKLNVGIYIKIHPTLSGKVYSNLQKQYLFEIIEKQIFPDVDIVISYPSTLAKEYEQIGKKVLYHTVDNIDIVIQNIINLEK